MNTKSFMSISKRFNNIDYFVEETYRTTMRATVHLKKNLNFMGKSSDAVPSDSVKTFLRVHVGKSCKKSTKYIFLIS